MDKKKKIAEAKARKTIQAEKKNLKGREIRSMSEVSGPFDPDFWRNAGNLHNTGIDPFNKPKEFRFPIPKNASTKRWSQK